MESERMNIEQIYSEFAILEKACLGYEEYINAEEKNFADTLERLRKLVMGI